MPLRLLCDVGDEAVLRDVVRHVGPAQVVDQLEVEPGPADLGEEHVVEAVAEAGQELARHCQEYQGPPPV